MMLILTKGISSSQIRPSGTILPPPPPSTPPAVDFTLHANFGIPNSPKSPDIGQNSDEGISDSLISGQSLIN